MSSNEYQDFSSYKTTITCYEKSTPTYPVKTCCPRWVYAILGLFSIAAAFTFFGFAMTSRAGVHYPFNDWIPFSIGLTGFFTFSVVGVALLVYSCVLKEREHTWLKSVS
jgi:hypothetical protein